MSFRRRKTGTPRQIGQVFPVRNPLYNGHTRPKLQYPRAFTGKSFQGESFRGQNPLTVVEQRAIDVEDELKKAGMKGWTITVKYKDGVVEDFPIIADSFEHAMDTAKDKLSEKGDMVYEITIVDPLLGEVLHKIGSGAAKAAKFIGKGAWKAVKGLSRVAKKIPGQVERAALSTSETMGRAASLPTRMGETYEEAYERRDWPQEPEPAPPSIPVAKWETAAAYRTGRAAQAPMTMQEWRQRTPDIYKPEEEQVDPTKPFQHPSPLYSKKKKARTLSNAEMIEQMMRKECPPSKKRLSIELE